MGEVVEHEEHEGDRGYKLSLSHTHTHTQIGLSSLARTTNSIEVARKRPFGRSPAKRSTNRRSYESRRVKRPNSIEVQAKDQIGRSASKRSRLVEVTKEIQ
jgi:hypothetical protein